MPLISRIAANAARAYGMFTLALKDAYFNYTTLLLPGNGTNGAQNNTFLDSSSNAFTITRNGNTTQGTFTPFSQTGWGNYLNGSTDYLTAATNAAFATPAEYTVEFWAYQTASPTNYASYYLVNVTNGLQIGFNTAGGGVFGVANNYVGWQLTTAAFSLNQWTHIAITRDSSNVTRIFYNGTLQTSGTITTSYVQGELRIGNSGSNNGYISGYVSNMRYLKGTALYTANFTPPTTPLTAITNTQLLTCQSNRFIDNSTNAFALTVTGSPSVQAFSPFAPTAAYSASTVGGSGYFDGSGDYLTVPDNAALQMDSSNFTYEGWVYPTGSPGSINSMYGKRANGGSYGNINIAYWNTGGIGLYVSSSTSTWDIFADNGSIIAFRFNAWNHFALVRSSNNWAFFVNGVRTHSTVNASSLAPNSGVAMSLGAGAADGAQPIQGYLNGMRVIKGTAVYDPTLTTCTVPTAPLTAITNTQLLTNFTNAGIYDATAKNDLETVGNAQISTTQSKFGGSSIYFDGTNSKAVMSSSVNMYMTGDFTIECWVYWTGTAAYYQNFVGSNNTFTSNASFFRVWGTASPNNANKIGIGNPTHDAASSVFSTNNLPTNQWVHVAATRSSGIIRVFINGNLEKTGSSDTSVYDFGQGGTCVGDSPWDGAQGWFSGYIDDLRITKGYARYTAAFTPPTGPFPLQ